MSTPQSNLPRAMRQQVKNANAQVQALASGQPVPGVAPAAAETQPPPNLPNVGAPPPADAVPVAPAAAAAPAAPASPGPAATAQPAAPVPNEFEQKYRVLQGKYNQEMREREKLIHEQNQLIQQLRTPAQPAPAAPASPTEMARSMGVTDKQIQDFGPDLVELIGNIALNTAQRTVAPVAQQMGQVSQVVGQTAQRVAASSQDHVWAALRQSFGPDAEIMNGSSEFLDWVNQNDIFSGLPRKTGLMSAFESGDATRVVAIFRAFKNEEDARRATADPARTPQIDPATLLAPGQARGDGGAAPGNASGRIWSETEVRDFYSRVQRGRISPQEKASTEADLRAAIRDGRVRPDRTNSHLLNNA